MLVVIWENNFRLSLRLLLFINRLCTSTIFVTDLSSINKNVTLMVKGQIIFYLISWGLFYTLFWSKHWSPLWGSLKFDPTSTKSEHRSTTRRKGEPKRNSRETYATAAEHLRVTTTE